MEQDVINIDGVDYKINYELVETDYGPEMAIEILDEAGEVIHRSQEAMSIEAQVKRWAEDQVDWSMTSL